jgi:glycosyltransferase involved in cell wall biosynthesis
MTKTQLENSTSKHEIILSLIVVTYNRNKELYRFLESITKQEYHSRIEIILINQGSPLKSIQEIFDKYNWKLIEVGKIMPLSIARNIGLDFIKGKIIAFPDDDCWYAPGFIDNIISKFAEHQNYECICVSVFDPIKNKTYGKRPLDIKRKISFKNVIQLPVSVGIFVRATIIKKHSIRFNENLGAGTFLGGGEETAFVCSLLKHEGKAIYDGSLRVYHELDDYTLISLDKVKKYSRGYGFIIGSILAEKKFIVIPAILIFIIKSTAALLLKSYKRKYIAMYTTRIRFFFVGIYSAFKTRESVF